MDIDNSLRRHGLILAGSIDICAIKPRASSTVIGSSYSNFAGFIFVGSVFNTIKIFTQIECHTERQAGPGAILRRHFPGDGEIDELIEVDRLILERSPEKGVLQGFLGRN